MACHHRTLMKISRIWPLLNMKKAAKQQQRLRDEQERLVRNEIPSSHTSHPPLHHTIKPPPMIVNGIHGHRNDRGIDGSGTSKTSNSTRLTILNDSYSWNAVMFKNDQIPDMEKTSSSQFTNDLPKKLCKIQSWQIRINFNWNIVQRHNSFPKLLSIECTIEYWNRKTCFQ